LQSSNGGSGEESIREEILQLEQDEAGEEGKAVLNLYRFMKGEG
jgi:hypothetical protein